MFLHEMPGKNIYFARIKLVTTCKHISRLPPLRGHCTSTGLPILPRAKTAPVGRWMRTLPSPSNCSISTRMRAISKFLPPESEFRWTAPKPLSGSHDAIVWPWPRSDVNLRGSGLRATGTLIRNRRGIFSRILIEWHDFLLNPESRGGQQWSLPNLVPSSLKWTPPGGFRDETPVPGSSTIGADGGRAR